MNRRDFVPTTLAAATVAASVATSVASSVQAETTTSSKPSPQPKLNVLYLFSDQHREASLPGKPFCPVIAPALDAFRRDNFEMQNCISNYPLCTPYRAILMTGRYPQRTGITGNGKTLAPDPNALGHTFAKAGYHTGYVGKWHLEDFHEQVFVPEGPRRQGFQDWRMWAATGTHYGAWTFNPETGEKIQPKGWNATLMTDDAITFLEKQPRENPGKPWFLVVSWNPPHNPFNPPPEDSSGYAPADLPFRPNLEPPTAAAKAYTPWVESEEKLRQAQSGYYGSITGIDKEFGRVLAALEATGQAANTVVVYTSDHGEMMGSHGLGQKQVPFEESCHVPFFVRVPGATVAGSASPALMGAIDIYPTLCGLAGIQVPPHCDGRDLSATITGTGTSASTDGILLMDNRGAGFVPQDTLPTYRGIRTATHTYAVSEGGRWILYDNIADPFQQKNLVANPSQRALMTKLDQHILAWQATVHDDFDLKAAATKITAYPS